MTAPLDRAGMRERHRPTLLHVEVPVPCVLCCQDWPCDAVQALDALEEAQHWKGDFTQACRQRDALESEIEKVRRERNEAFKVLSRLGLVQHAGTWITREEADRISKDGP